MRRLRTTTVAAILGGGFVVTMLALALFVFARPALAEPSCTITWAGSSGGGEWADPGNWSPSRTPTSGDVVCIQGVTGPVTFDGSNGTSTTLISGLRSSAPLNITGGELALTDPSVTGNTVGGFSLAGGQLGDTTNVQGSLTDKGDFSWTGGFFYAPASQQTRPALTVSSGHTAVINFFNPDSNGLDRWNLSFASPLSVGSSTHIGFQNGGGITASSTVTFADETTGNADIVDAGSAGPFTLTGTGVLTKTSTTGTATIDVPVVSAGIVRAGGGVLSLTSLTNTGTLDLSKGFISIGSAYTPSATSKLAVTIAGTTAGSTYGQLRVSGTMHLTGTLKISTAKTFAPKAGQTFAIATTSGQTTGKFTSIVQSITPNGIEYKVKVATTGVTLTAVKAPN
jgi:hypothetical protein